MAWRYKSWTIWNSNARHFEHGVCYNITMLLVMRVTELRPILGNRIVWICYAGYLRQQQQQAGRVQATPGHNSHIKKQENLNNYSTFTNLSFCVKDNVFFQSWIRDFNKHKIFFLAMFCVSSERKPTCLGKQSTGGRYKSYQWRQTCLLPIRSILWVFALHLQTYF
jgi:hypothetical protein